MHIRWKRRRLRSNRQTGEKLCPHHRIRQPETLTPALMHYEAGRYKTLWRPGPCIRVCCLENGLALASWWTEVERRFNDPTTTGVTAEFADAIWESEDLLLKLLEDVVPYPTKRDFKQYDKFCQENGYACRGRIVAPEAFVVMGLQWPCTPDEIKAQWKKLALASHPDRGGDAADFVKYKAAYDEAMQYAESA